MFRACNGRGWSRIFKWGGGGGEIGWHLAESREHSPESKLQVEYWDLISVAPEILAIPQSRNYNKVPVQRVCLNVFCHI